MSPDLANRREPPSHNTKILAQTNSHKQRTAFHFAVGTENVLGTAGGEEAMVLRSPVPPPQEEPGRQRRWVSARWHCEHFQTEYLENLWRFRCPPRKHQLVTLSRGKSPHF